MIYSKNVPVWERFLRGGVGAALIAFGLLGLKGGWIGGLAALSGLGLMLTGWVGFCPMCALAGRKIQPTPQNKP